MDFGKNIKTFREKYNLTQAELGKIAGVSNKAVSAWEANRSLPLMGAIERIAQHFNIKKSEIIEPLLNKKEIPFFDIPASAGNGSVVYDGIDFEYEEFKNIPNNADFAVLIRGNSMEPKYFNDDIVFVKKDVIVEQGQVGIFILNSESYLKTLIGNQLVSFNKEYKSIDITENDQFRIIGKVVGKA